MILSQRLEELSDEIKENIIIEDDKVYFPYDSDFLFYIYSVIVFIVFIAFCFIIAILLDVQDNEIKNILAFILPLVLVIICHLLYAEFTELFRVIDANKGCIYTEIRFMGYPIIELDNINIKDINEIGNNCISVELEKKTKMNRKTAPDKIDVNENTGFYHRYGVSLLLKNGEIYHLIDLGYSIDDFYNSMELADVISKSLKLDLIVNESNCFLKTVMSKNRYKFKKEIITKEQVNRDEGDRRLILHIILYAIMLVFIIAYKLGTASGS